MVQDQFGRVFSAERGGCVRRVLGFGCRLCAGPGDLGWGCAGSHLWDLLFQGVGTTWESSSSCCSA